MTTCSQARSPASDRRIPLRRRREAPAILLSGPGTVARLSTGTTPDLTTTRTIHKEQI
jgi:hypothetical protein